MRHAAIAIAVLAVASPAEAKPRHNAKADAKRHVDAGTKAHKAGNFEVALTELQAAYDLDPEPKLLFAIAQVQVKLDRCPDAIPNYEKFLASTKDKKKQAIVKQAIDACNAKVAAEPAPAVTNEPAPTEVAPPPAATTEHSGPVETQPPAPPVEPTLPPPETAFRPAPPPRATTGDHSAPWYKDMLGDALVLGGVAAGAVSLVMYAGARSSLDDAENATTLPDYRDAVDDAKSKRNVSLVLAGGSVVLIGAGILRYRLRSHGEAHGVAIAPSSGGGMITWTGGF